MSNNPIRYRDFIEPDGSISGLIDELKKLRDVYAQSVSEIRKQAEELGKGLSSVSGATEDGRESIENYAKETARLSAEYQQAQSQIKALEARIKSLEAVSQRQKGGTVQLTKAFKDMTAAERSELIEAQRNAATKRENNALARAAVKAAAAEKGSYDRLSAQYTIMKIALNKMSEEGKAGSTVFNNLQNSANRLYEQMKQLQSATGKHTLNVGNYTSAFGMLGMQVQQVARELPSLAVGWNTFFLAVSNNLPILVDQIVLARQEVARLRAEGQKVTPVWKQLLKSIGSWQTLLVVGITLLSVYGKEIVGWVKNLGKSQAAIDAESRAMERAEFRKKSYKQATEQQARSLGDMVAKYRILQHQWSQNRTEEEKLKWIKRMQSEFGSLGVKIGNATQAQKYFTEMSDDVIRAMEAQTKAAAATNLVSDFYTKYYEDLQKAYAETRKGTALLGDRGTFDAVMKYTKALGKYKKDIQDKGTTTFGDGVDGHDNTKMQEWSVPGAQLIETSSGFSSIKTLNVSDKKTFGKWFNQLQYDYRQYLFAQLEKQLGMDTKFLIDEIGKQNGIYTSLKEKIDGALGGQGESGGGGSISVADLSKDIAEAYKSISYQLAESSAQLIPDPFEKGVAELENKLSESSAKLDEVRDKWQGILNANKGAKGGLFSYDGKAYRELTQSQADSISEMLGRLNEVRTNLTLRNADEYNKLVREQRIKRLEEEKADIDLQLEIAEKGSEEELRLLREKIAKEREIELGKDGLSENDKSAITKKYGNRDNKAQYDYAIAKYDREAELEELRFMLYAHTEDEITRYQKEAQIERLRQMLEYGKKYGTLTKQQIEKLELQIEKGENELKAKEESPEQYGSFYDLIGLKDITDENGKDITSEVIAGIDASLDAAKEALSTWMQARQQAAEQSVQNADKEVDSAQRWLDAEREARANGYANNVEMAQKELNAAKKNQQKALKEQQRVKRQQMAIDAAQQASSLTLATANIWATFTKMGAFGVPAAIAATAVMWGSFLASRIKAFQISKSQDSATEKYRNGTVELLAGGSHRSGRDIDLGRKPDGTRRRAEGGEFFAVINKRSSRKYRDVIPDVIRSLNDDTFARKYMRAYDMQNVGLIPASGGTDVSALERDVKAIRQQNERRYYTEADGTKVEVYKNLTRRTRL